MVFAVVALMFVPHTTPTASEPQYTDMGDQLLTEFLHFHNEYTPEVIMLRCSKDETWQYAGALTSQGFTWAMVLVPDGSYSFAFSVDSVQPMVVVFVPKPQPFIGMQVRDAVKALTEEATLQFKRRPDMVIGNMIIYSLTDTISAVILVAPDGSYSVGTGFSKYIQLPEYEDA